MYFQTEDYSEPICIFTDVEDATLKDYGIFSIYGKQLLYWDFYLPPDLSEGFRWYHVPMPDSNQVVESFAYDGSICIGYKTSSGKTYPLPSFDEVKQLINPTESPTPTQTPTQTPTPTPTPISSNKPGIQPQQTTQPMPTQSSDYDTETKVSKSGNSVEVTQDGEVIASVTFNKKKAVANFKIGEENKKVKKVKQAFIIGDSYNYGYITKSNKFKTINRETGKVKSYSGKWKKAIIKKNVAVKIVKLKGSKKKTITGF